MSEPKRNPPEPTKPEPSDAGQATVAVPEKAEHGGPKGLEPTRFGDWERNGRCFDF